MDQRRKRQRRSAAGEKLTDRYRQRREEQQAGPTDAVEQVMQREAVEFARRILEQLPEDQRAIVMLRIHQDLTLRQIAEVMHMSLSNVNYRMNQALRTMAGQMKKAGVI
jgi:RNA polymerase sigma-70 factor (ECF subfamily)